MIKINKCRYKFPKIFLLPHPKRIFIIQYPTTQKKVITTHLILYYKIGNCLIASVKRKHYGFWRNITQF